MGGSDSAKCSIRSSQIRQRLKYVGMWFCEAVVKGNGSCCLVSAGVVCDM